MESHRKETQFEYTTKYFYSHIDCLSYIYNIVLPSNSLDFIGRGFNEKNEYYVTTIKKH